jgi:hypothetical protein
MCAFSALVKKQDRSGTKNGLIAVNFRIVGNWEVNFWFARDPRSLLVGASDTALRLSNTNPGSVSGLAI